MPPASTDIVVVDFRHGGTILENLPGQPAELLAEVAHDLRAHEKRLTEMRKAVEAELVQRFDNGSKKPRVTAGAFELEIDRGWTRVWDGDDLELVLHDLADRRLIHRGDWTGLINREPKVNGKLAMRLLGSLVGTAKAEVEQCFRWKTKATPTLTITPSLPLIEEET